MSVKQVNEPEIKPPILNFKSKYFGSGLGYILYYFSSNKYIWNKLNDKEKDFIKKHNDYWNNNNPGYKDPENYQGQGGLSFNSLSDRTIKWEGRELAKFLDTEKPKRILEIGPGSGFYTRQLIESRDIEQYTATDINVKFLDFIKHAIDRHQKGKQIECQYLTLSEFEKSKKEVDAIIIFSAVHHIPDRREFINYLSSLLPKGGSIFLFEPTHSFRRMIRLAYSFVINGWYLNKVVNNRNNYMTHHFCTLSEMQENADYSGLKVENWNLKSLLPKYMKSLSFAFSEKLTVVLRK